jgi:hypothetical protein
VYFLGKPCFFKILRVTPLSEVLILPSRGRAAYFDNRGDEWMAFSLNSNIAKGDFKPFRVILNESSSQ